MVFLDNNANIYIYDLKISKKNKLCFDWNSQQLKILDS